eukprot:TRINITY_DN1770_c0_g1_i1.p1 TRINITY_DN1770_c0_g1~~TRINITY_DN1770_c0_g1_i1.p1  ORF type:complete len:325 (-),score=62.88 TRINITY_DN1770_c0_g1_i1:38-907(-)
MEQEQEQLGVMSVLPGEVREHVWQFVGPVSLTRLMSVSRQWRAETSDQWLWRQFCQQHLTLPSTPKQQQQQQQQHQESAFLSVTQLPQGITSWFTYYRALKSVPKRQLWKVVLLGELRCGKTSLMQRWVDNKFTEYHRQTSGVDVKFKRIKMGHTEVTIEIWDTARNHSSASMYQDAVGLIVMFDLSSNPRFRSPLQQHNDFFKHDKAHDFPKILLGNKADISSDPAEAQRQWAEENNYLYFSTSCKDDDNVTEAFSALIAWIGRAKATAHLASLHSTSLPKQTVPATE